MNVNDNNLDKFLKIYKNYFGKDINKDDALREAVKLLNFIDIIVKQKHEPRN